MTLPVIVVATGLGTPRCRSTHRRIDGPSLSRKKRVRAANERPKNSDVSPWMPLIAPLTSVEITLEASELALEPALDEVESSTPRLFAQLWSWSTAALAFAEI